MNNSIVQVAYTVNDSIVRDWPTCPCHGRLTRRAVRSDIFNRVVVYELGIVTRVVDGDGLSKMLLGAARVGQ